MKIIFLDVDGVLNTSETFIQVDRVYDETGISIVELDEFRIEYLRRIVDATGAKIVLSSSWRLMFKKEDNGIFPLNYDAFCLFSLLLKYNLLIYDITGQDRCGIRENEIKEWLSLHDDVENYVIIDDDTYDLIDFIGKNIIKTSIGEYGVMLMNMDDCTGLCEEHIQEAINMLNGKNYAKILIK